MSKLYIMMGLPGLGKSTYAKDQIMKVSKNTVLISSDDLRAALLDDVNRQDQNPYIFDIMYQMTLASLRNGKNVIYDSTGLKESKRRELVKRLKENLKGGIEKVIGVYCTGSVEDAGFKNVFRERKVPEEVIKNLSKKFDIPTKRDEYFDDIVYHTVFGLVGRSVQMIPSCEDYEEFTMRMSNIVASYERNVDLPQDCPYHTLSVSRHIYEAFKYGQVNMPKELIKWRSNILFALAFHDCGKYLCKEFRSGSKYAHFTGHESVSAQIFMGIANTSEYFLRADTEIDFKFIAALIKEHGFAYKEKDIFKYENALSEIELIYGKDFRDCLEFMRECDKSAH